MLEAIETTSVARPPPPPPPRICGGRNHIRDNRTLPSPKYGLSNGSNNTKRVIIGSVLHRSAQHQSVRVDNNSIEAIDTRRKTRFSHSHSNRHCPAPPPPKEKSLEMTRRQSIESVAKWPPPPPPPNQRNVDIHNGDYMPTSSSSFRPPPPPLMRALTAASSRLSPRPTVRPQANSSDNMVKSTLTHSSSSRGSKLSSFGSTIVITELYKQLYPEAAPRRPSPPTHHETFSPHRPNSTSRHKKVESATDSVSRTVRASQRSGELNKPLSGNGSGVVIGHRLNGDQPWGSLIVGSQIAEGDSAGTNGDSISGDGSVGRIPKFRSTPRFNGPLSVDISSEQEVQEAVQNALKAHKIQEAVTNALKAHSVATTRFQEVHQRNGRVYPDNNTHQVANNETQNCRDVSDTGIQCGNDAKNQVVVHDGSINAVVTTRSNSIYNQVCSYSKTAKGDSAGTTASSSGVGSSSMLDPFTYTNNDSSSSAGILDISIGTNGSSNHSSTMPDVSVGNNDSSSSAGSLMTSDPPIKFPLTSQPRYTICTPEMWRQLSKSEKLTIMSMNLSIDDESVESDEDEDDDDDGERDQGELIHDSNTHLLITSHISSMCNEVNNFLNELDCKNSQG